MEVIAVNLTLVLILTALVQMVPHRGEAAVSPLNAMHK